MSPHHRRPPDVGHPTPNPEQPQAPTREPMVSEPAMVAGIDVDRVAAAVQACPAVAGLSAGRFGAVATLQPGRRIIGIRVEVTAGTPARTATNPAGPASVLDAVRVEVHVAARYPTPLTVLAAEIRAAALAAGCTAPVGTHSADGPSGPIAAAASEPDGGPGRAEAADRGRLHIADTVLEKVAVRAASGLDHVGGAARRLLGVHVSSEDPDRAVRAQITRRGATATAALALSVTYPAPIAQVAATARAVVADQIAASTGVAVDRVDITVTALHQPTRPGRTLT